MWIDYEEDLNCTNVSIAKNGAMTLRQVAERHKLSFVRIQQIEKKALKKLKSKMQK
jgi:DNA-directed RNA polymerase sigma subunit (sigma70/sigma32)